MTFAKILLTIANFIAIISFFAYCLFPKLRPTEDNELTIAGWIIGIILLIANVVGFVHLYELSGL